MEKFESNFSRFLEKTEYDNAEKAIYTLVRAAYVAGWVAAGGKEFDECIVAHQAED